MNKQLLAALIIIILPSSMFLAILFTSRQNPTSPQPLIGNKQLPPPIGQNPPDNNGKPPKNNQPPGDYQSTSSDNENYYNDHFLLKIINNGEIAIFLLISILSTIWIVIRITRGYFRGKTTTYITKKF